MKILTKEEIEVIEKETEERMEEFMKSKKRKVEIAAQYQTTKTLKRHIFLTERDVKNMKGTRRKIPRYESRSVTRNPIVASVAWAQCRKLGYVCGFCGKEIGEEEKTVVSHNFGHGESSEKNLAFFEEAREWVREMNIQKTYKECYEKYFEHHYLFSVFHEHCNQHHWELKDTFFSLKKSLDLLKMKINEEEALGLNPNLSSKVSSGTVLEVAKEKSSSYQEVFKDRGHVPNREPVVSPLPRQTNPKPRKDKKTRSTASLVSVKEKQTQKRSPTNNSTPNLYNSLFSGADEEKEGQCMETAKNTMRQCKRKAIQGKVFCDAHDPERPRCEGLTVERQKCRIWRHANTKYCKIHQNQDLGKKEDLVCF